MSDESSALNSSQLRLVGGERLRVEAGESNFFGQRVRGHEGRALAHGDLDRLVERVAIDAAADRGESDRVDAVRLRELEALAVARGEKLRLAALAPAPHRTDRVDHVPGRKLVAA